MEDLKLDKELIKKEIKEELKAEALSYIKNIPEELKNISTEKDKEDNKDKFDLQKILSVLTKLKPIFELISSLK